MRGPFDQVIRLIGHHCWSTTGNGRHRMFSINDFFAQCAALASI